MGQVRSGLELACRQNAKCKYPCSRGPEPEITPSQLDIELMLLHSGKLGNPNPKNPNPNPNPTPNQCSL